MSEPGAVRAAAPALTTPAKELLTMAAKPLPPVEYLRQRLRYEPETGKLYWREHPNMPTHWNTRYAGTEAFTANFKGYRHGTFDYGRYLAHRVAWALHHGHWPDNTLDHVNHDPADNRIENLRQVSQSDNMKNMKRHRNNTSGTTGVFWHSRRRKWLVNIRAHGRTLHLGYFADKQDAVAARKAAEARYGFHPNHGINALQSA
jgi:hypothetical protein